MKRLFIFLLMAMFVVSGCSSNTQATINKPGQPEEQKEPIINTFDKWKTNQAIEAIKAAGLEFENPREMTKDDYGMAPMMAKEGIRFFVPSLGPDNGGRLYSFATKEEMDKTKDYYIKLGKENAKFFSWVIEKDNILIQINGDLKEDAANKYKDALANMK